MKIIKGIFVVIFIILGVMFYSVSVVPGGIVCWAFAAVTFFFMPTKSPKKKREEYLKTINAIEIFTGTHIAGLPIGETTATITFFKDQITIEGGGAKFNIDINRLRDVMVKQDSEIRVELKNSLVGGAGGGFLFGPAGAIIGSRTSKKNLEVTMYFIINYINKSGAMESICFDMGTYKNGGGNLIALAESDAKQRLKKVKALIPVQNYEVDL